MEGTVCILRLCILTHTVHMHTYMQTYAYLPKLTHTYAHVVPLLVHLCTGAVSFAKLEMYISQRAGWSSNEADFKLAAQ